MVTIPHVLEEVVDATVAGEDSTNRTRSKSNIAPIRSPSRRRAVNSNSEAMVMISPMNKGGVSETNVTVEDGTNLTKVAERTSSSKIADDDQIAQRTRRRSGSRLEVSRDIESESIVSVRKPRTRQTNAQKEKDK